MATDTNRVPGWWREAFLESLRHTPIISRATRRLGIDRMTPYMAMRTDPAFKAEVEAAKAEGIDRVEAAAFKRAVSGTTKGVWHQGQRVGEEKVYSDALLLAILKGYRREVYTERTEVTGANGEPLMAGIVDDTAKAARLAALVAIAKAREASARDAEPELPDLDDIV